MGPHCPSWPLTGPFRSGACSSAHGALTRRFRRSLRPRILAIAHHIRRRSQPARPARARRAIMLWRAHARIGNRRRLEREFCPAADQQAPCEREFWLRRHQNWPETSRGRVLGFRTSAAGGPASCRSPVCNHPLDLGDVSQRASESDTTQAESPDRSYVHTLTHSWHGSRGPVLPLAPFSCSGPRLIASRAACPADARRGVVC